MPNISRHRLRRRVRSNQAGSQIVDFAAALIMLIIVVFVPLLDLTILPIRCMLAQEIVNGYIRKLALCETFSQSFRVVEADPSLATKLAKLGGVSCQSMKLRMRVTRLFQSPHPEESILVEQPGKIPKQWLPDGDKAPNLYSMELEIKSLISPAILFFPGNGLSIPGLTAPVPFTITASRNWENFGRNPVSKQFFLNE